MRRLLSDESGASTAELALTLPLLLIVLIGAVQIALVHHARTVAETAAVEGARLAAAEGHTLTEGAARTRELLEAGLGPTGAAFAVSAETQGDVVIARASGTYPLIIPWVTSLSLPIDVSAEVWREAFRDGP
ncbi:MAG: pilus assembly protein [Dehalococcoidia bacterium]|nr:MAG: pilus assembly protein [Dehalococcoidia bacterium]